MEKMDISDTADEEHDRKKVFKLNHKVFDNINVDCNSSSTFVIIWNKYQIFIYEIHNLESPSLILTPEFSIHRLIVTNNYLICLDFDGDVHTISLKFKTTPQKRKKHSFLSQNQKICCWAIYNEELIITLKIEFGTYLLSLHKTNSLFELYERKLIRYEQTHWPLIEAKLNKCLMKTCVINNSDCSYMDSIFSTRDLKHKPYTMVLISFDKYNVYSCLYDEDTSDEISIIKLYDCPTKICEIQIIRLKSYLNILIGLTCGTIIRLSLHNKNKIELIHLNTAISKFTVINESVIFTDGITLWRADKIESNKEIAFKQFFVQLVRDFVVVNGNVLCTTSNHQIYVFSLHDNKVYLDSNNDEYVPADRILNNSQCIHYIFKEIEKSNILKDKLKQENDYALILSLGNRQDVMDTVIQNKVTVYEDYNEVVNEHDRLLLTNKFEEYHECNTFLVLTQISTTDSHEKIANVLLTSKCDLTLHIKFSSAKSIFTASIQIEQLKQINVLVPIHERFIVENQLNVDIKVMSNIPGPLDKKQTIWAMLYRKQVLLNSEHFIRTNLISNKRIILKQPKESVNDLVLKTAINFHSDLFSFDDVVQSRNEKSYYVKVPYNYKELLTNEDYYKSIFSTRKADYLTKQISSEQFLESKHCITLEICKEKVKIELITDFATPQLMVTSLNPKLSFNIRNFFGELFYKNIESSHADLRFVPFALHATSDILQKKLTSVANETDFEEVQELIEQFDKNIFGALPL